MLEEIGPRISALRTEHFVRKAMPDVPFRPNFFHEVLCALIAKSEYDDGNKLWTTLPADPSNTEGHEDQVYAPMAKLVETILGTCERLDPRLKRTAAYHQLPRYAPRSTGTRADRLLVRPDAYLLVLGNKSRAKPLSTCGEEDRTGDGREDKTTKFGVVIKLSSPGHHWVDIIDISEFKKLAEKEGEAVLQLVFGMHHVLDSYMNRSLVYGTTIVNRQTRFWKMSREGLVTTEPIDFHTDALLFIEHMARLAFASKAQLGIEHTVTLTQDKERIATVSIDKKTYSVVRTLFEHPAHNIRSRGTRVFAVRCQGNAEGVPHMTQKALKDYWTQKRRASETKILDGVTEAYAKVNTNLNCEEAKQTALAHFMPVKAEWVVEVDGRPHQMPGDVDDKTGHAKETYPLPLTGMFGEVLPASLESQSRSLSGQDLRTTRLSHAPTAASTSKVLYQRQHRRVLYGEVGTPLWQLGDPRRMIKVALGCAEGACKVLVQVEIAHRDPSPNQMYEPAELGQLWRSVELAEKEGRTIKEIDIAQAEAHEPLGQVGDPEYMMHFLTRSLIGADGVALPTGEVEALIGTVYYMSCELLQRQRCFLPQTTTANIRPPPAEKRASTPILVVPKPSKRLDFTPHVGHDMEGLLLWPLVWIAVSFVVVDYSEMSQARQAAHNYLFGLEGGIMGLGWHRHQWLSSGEVDFQGKCYSASQLFELEGGRVFPEQLLPVWGLAEGVRVHILKMYKDWQTDWEAAVFSRGLDDIIATYREWLPSMQRVHIERYESSGNRGHARAESQSTTAEQPRKKKPRGHYAAGTWCT